jgi:predicted SAM-dependent methyltransferase
MRFDDIPEGGIKVIIGTRTWIDETWTHVDIDSRPLTAADGSRHPVDVVCDARKLNLPDNYADFVFTSECLEHFPWREYPKVLAEWCRIVKVGGRIRVEVPDFLLACKQILEGDSLETDRAMQQIFFAEQLNEYDFHYVGLTPRMLTDDFDKLNFEVERIERGSDWGWLMVQAVKLK